MDVATCMYYTGLDPMTMRPVHVARHPRDRKPQRALMQFFQPENDSAVRRALSQAGRRDLVGDGEGCLIPSKPRKPAASARRPRGRSRRGSSACPK
jgi:hypothetical protein